MKMIVGLGNPGPKYKNNRHNIGYQIVDLLADRHGLAFDVKRGKAVAAVGVITLPADDPALPPVQFRVALVKPQAFMNLSGPPTLSLMQFYKVDKADLLVVYDELDLPGGVIRLRPSGGAGGHNGMRSLISSLGGNDFARLRVGIDRPPGRMDPAAYVLQDFSATQEELMAQVRPQATDACEHWMSHEIEATMNIFNARGATDS